MLFVSAAQKVREKRQWLRFLGVRLWREDGISATFDELCPDKVPGDILGLRRLFNMEEFPGPVEDEEWDTLWDFFNEWPLLMPFMIGFYRRRTPTPTAPVRPHSV
ncbi:a3.1 [Ichnoviriform fugitivi]|uniref:A3.1 n=1 Tax=Ichnoviriform fugitivi TaxID=265522 RepID=A2Q0D0_9VIRU|nr:a3.1 [Ichnoviriform fugitivi]BAF45645.1 a3.1 [Ichnoviriform fugitivi]